MSAEDLAKQFEGCKLEAYQDISRGLDNRLGACWQGCLRRARVDSAAGG